MRLAVSLLPFVAMGCAQEQTIDETHAIVDINRSDHFFDHPFPADSLRDASGRVDLSGYPVTGLSMTLPVIEGWRDRAEASTQAFGNASAVYTTSGDVAKEVMSRVSAGMCGVNIGVPVPREPFGFGGWNDSKFGHGNITGWDGYRFWTRPRKISSKWALQKDTTWMS